MRAEAQAGSKRGEGVNLKDLADTFAGLSEVNRPIRLRLAQGKGVLDDVLQIGNWLVLTVAARMFRASSMGSK